jgi:hypothetical protein
VFFDPGRQKRGIAPIADMGRSLTEGKSYTLVVDAEWRDGNGLPLTQQFKRTFKVGPPDEHPLDPRTWKIAPPASATRAALTVAFPEPLDHGLLLRALGVLSPDGKPLPGTVTVGTPADVVARRKHHGLRVPTTSSRSRCSKISLAIESAAPLRLIISIVPTRPPSLRRH